MPPTLRAMVQVQRLTGCRPSEIFNMKVVEIDQHTDSVLWLYHLPHHKTENKVNRKKIIPLGKPEQELIAPYLENKTAEQAVFSPRTAMQERSTEKRANRQTKISPSQAKRNAARAAKPHQYKEFYNKDSYRQAIEHAINKGNKSLPDGKKIPPWTPYQIRHTAATAMELAAGLEESQALLDHSSANTTRRYAHGRLEKLKGLRFTPQKKKKMKKRILMIGNTDDLRGVPVDMNDYYYFFLSPADGNWRSDEIDILMNPTRRELRSTIREIENADYDYLITIFSGHGCESDGETILGLNGQGETIAMSELTNLSPKQLLLLDCCRISALMPEEIAFAVVGTTLSISRDTIRQSLGILPPKPHSAGSGTISCAARTFSRLRRATSSRWELTKSNRRLQ